MKRGRLALARLTLACAALAVVSVAGYGLLHRAPAAPAYRPQATTSAGQPAAGPARPIIAAQEPIERFREERGALRDEERRQLDAIIEDEKTTPEIRSAAQRQRMDLLTWMEQEMTIEGVLAAKGFADPVVTVHRDSVNVMVKIDQLTRAQAAAILDVVSRETGQTGGNIKIIPLGAS